MHRRVRKRSATQRRGASQMIRTVARAICPPSLCASIRAWTCRPAQRAPRGPARRICAAAPPWPLHRTRSPSRQRPMASTRAMPRARLSLWRRHGRRRMTLCVTSGRRSRRRRRQRRRPSDRLTYATARPQGTRMRAGARPRDCPHGAPQRVTLAGVCPLIVPETT